MDTLLLRTTYMLVADSFSEVDRVSEELPGKVMAVLVKGSEPVERWGVSLSS